MKKDYIYDLPDNEYMYKNVVYSAYELVTPGRDKTSDILAVFEDGESGLKLIDYVYGITSMSETEIINHVHRSIIAHASKKEFNSRISADIENAVDDIFVKYQNEMNITSGDIDPVDTLLLTEAQNSLASVINDVLMKQPISGDETTK